MEKADKKAADSADLTDFNPWNDRQFQEIVAQESGREEDHHYSLSDLSSLFSMVSPSSADSVPREEV